MAERLKHSLKQELIVGFSALSLTGAIAIASIISENERLSSGVGNNISNNTKDPIRITINIPRECIDYATKTLEKSHNMPISNPNAPDELPSICDQDK